MATAAAPPLSGLRRTLRRQFGFRSLREGQEEVIRSVMAGQDTLAIMPTGAGKSLCYQLPGVELPGTTVIVSPLISLMKDQVDKLHELGIEAAQVNSTLTASEENETLEAIEKEQRDFVFTTPERLAQPEFLETLKTNRVTLFVIDEAHCISEWGHDFRPAYLSLRQAIEALGNPPVLALTATATEQVVEDILERLGRPGMEVVDTGLYRENLDLEVFPAPDEERKRAQLARLLRESAGMGIVYVSTVKHCEEVFEYLEGLGVPVARYHGRVGSRERRQNQDRFMAGELKAMIATNAFGMGIDKPDLRFVIHHHLPATVEAYYQEAGRAGRDGLPARCTLLFDPTDKNLHRFFQAGRYPDAVHLVNAYHTLERLAEAPEPPTLAELSAIAPISKTRLQQALRLFKQRGVVRETADRRYALVHRETTTEDLERMARAYRELDEQDRLKQEQMAAYADHRGCRWDYLVNYFGNDDAEAVSCGHCDRCTPALGPPPAEPSTLNRPAEELVA
jgi:ATP-dependent DNA helicase RecQ